MIESSDFQQWALSDRGMILLFLGVIRRQPSFRTHADKYVVGMCRQVSRLFHVAVTRFFSEITAGKWAQIALDIGRFSRDDGTLYTDVLVRRIFGLHT